MLDFADYAVPAQTQSALTAYIENGIPVGGFLRSVLCNDLMGAMSQIDSVNYASLPDITNWVFNCAPHGSWGNEAIYLRWIQDHPRATPGIRPLK